MDQQGREIPERNDLNDSPAAPIPIVFCITELEPGGAERCLVELVQRLDRRQFNPMVYCLGPRPTGNPTSLADTIKRHGVPLRVFGARRAARFPCLVWQVSRQLRIDRPRILQSFLFHANIVGTLAARLAGVPHVLTGVRVAERRVRGHLALARLTDRWVERHVCVSQSVSTFSQARGRLPAAKLVVIPNGVDIERFIHCNPCPLESLGINGPRRLIAFVGRLDRQKGLAWLLALMPRVLGEMPAYDLVLVGAGRERRKLVQLADQLGIGERVHFVGYRQDIPEILAASDVLVLPSEWEGMPNVVLEAMAAARPVVATDVEGVAEALGPTSDDQIVSLRSADLFATKLLAILKNPSLAASLGGANRQRATEVLSLDAMAAAYAALYHLLEANPSSSSSGGKSTVASN